MEYSACAKSSCKFRSRELSPWHVCGGAYAHVAQTAPAYAHLPISFTDAYVIGLSTIGTIDTTENLIEGVMRWCADR